MLRTCQILPVDSGYGHGCKTTKGASVNEGVFCRKQLGVILMCRSCLLFVLSPELGHSVSNHVQSL